jgi:hypothetical protein
MGYIDKKKVSDYQIVNKLLKERKNFLIKRKNNYNLSNNIKLQYKD